LILLLKGSVWKGEFDFLRAPVDDMNAELQAGDRQVLGLLADPGAPAEMASRIADDLAEASAEHRDGTERWAVRTQVRTLPPLTESYGDLADVARGCMDDEQWDAVVCLTDSPLRDGRYALIADLLRGSRIAVLSLPAFGALPLRRHVGAVAAELTQELTEPPNEQQSQEAEQRQEGAATTSRRFRRVISPDPDVTVRIIASHASMRLLVGLVLANRPWRLLAGLKGALAAALATSAYVLINSSAWQFADQVSLLKLTLMMVFAIAGMAVWLIVNHGLWESAAEHRNPRYSRLFNASTTVTLLMGLACAFVLLWLVNVLAEVFLIDAGFLETTLRHPVALGDYLAIAWFATSVSFLAGAIGSGFEDEDSVRKAAYSQRERERQQGQAQDSDS
jgi:hypothetical protein